MKSLLVSGLDLPRGFNFPPLGILCVRGAPDLLSTSWGVTLKLLSKDHPDRKAFHPGKLG